MAARNLTAAADARPAFVVPRAVVEAAKQSLSAVKAAEQTLGMSYHEFFKHANRRTLKKFEKLRMTQIAAAGDRGHRGTAAVDYAYAARRRRTSTRQLKPDVRNALPTSPRARPTRPHGRRVTRRTRTRTRTRTRAPARRDDPEPVEQGRRS